MIALLFVANASIVIINVDLFRFRLDFICSDAKICSGIICAWMINLAGVVQADENHNKWLAAINARSASCGVTF